jgi:hypothetical protein
MKAVIYLNPEFFDFETRMRIYLLGFLPTRALHRFSWRTFTPLFWKHWQPSRILRRRYPR